MRRRLVTLPENEELISPAVCAQPQIRLIESKQRVIEGIANGLLIRAAQ